MTSLSKKIRLLIVAFFMPIIFIGFIYFVWPKKPIKTNYKYVPEISNLCSKNKIRDLYFSMIMQAKNYEELKSILGSCKDNLEINLAIFDRLLDAVSSIKTTPLPPYNNMDELKEAIMRDKSIGFYSNGVPQHDLFIEGGRALWALEILLHTTLPTYAKETEENDITTKVLSQMTQITIKKIGSLDSLTAERKIEVAKASETPKVILIELAKSKNREIRKAVASNRSTPSQVLFKMAQKDSDLEIKKIADHTWALAGKSYP